MKVLEEFSIKTSTANRISENDQFEIQKRLLILLITSLDKAVIAFPITAAIISLIFWHQGHHTFLIFWLCSVMLLSITRYFTHFRIRHCDITKATYEKYLRHLLFFDLCGGVILGCLGFTLTYLSQDFQILTIVVIVAISQESVSGQASIKASFYAFNMPLFSIFIFWLLFSGGTFHYVLSALALLHAIFLFGSFSAFHNHLANNLELTYLNKNLANELQTKNLALAKSQLQTEAASEAKSTFIAELSQEIKTPITNLSNTINRAEQHADNPDVKNLLLLANAQSNTLLMLLNDLINVNLLEKSQLIKQSVKFNPRDLFESLAQTNALNIVSENVNLSCDIQPHIPTEVIADASRIREITNNLLSNAIKFTSTGKVRLSIDLQHQSNNALLIISVADTGVGIAKDKIDYIFQPFVKAEYNLTNTGRGLGLAVCQQLTKLLNGHITVDSVAGKRTVFHVNLPVEVVANHAPVYQGKKLLLVERDIDQRQSLIKQLQYLNIAFVEVELAKDAMAICAKDKNKFDAVLIGNQDKLAAKLLVNLAFRLNLKVICLYKSVAPSSNQASSNNYIPLRYPISCQQITAALVRQSTPSS